MRWNPPTAIVINVSPSRVTFNDPAGLPVVLAPIVYVTPGARRSRIVAVEEPPTGGAPTERVEVFGPGRPPVGVSKLDCFTALFRHGMKEIMDRSLFRGSPLRTQLPSLGRLSPRPVRQADKLDRSLEDSQLGAFVPHRATLRHRRAQHFPERSGHRWAQQPLTDRGAALSTSARPKRKLPSHGRRARTPFVINHA
jgi:hypothetical protein